MDTNRPIIRKRSIDSLQSLPSTTRRKICDQHESDTLPAHIQSTFNVSNQQDKNKLSSKTSLQVNIEPYKQQDTGKISNFSIAHLDPQISTRGPPNGHNDDTTSTSTSTYCDPLLEHFFPEVSTTSMPHSTTLNRHFIHGKHVFGPSLDQSKKPSGPKNQSFQSTSDSDTSSTVDYSVKQQIDHNVTEKQLREQLIRQQLMKHRSNYSTSSISNSYSTQNNDLVSYSSNTYTRTDSQLSNISDEFDLDELLPVKTRSIQKENYLPCYTPRSLLYNVLNKHLLSLACLGYVTNKINEDTKNIVRQCIIHAIEYIKNDPSNANNYKPFLLIGPLLFIDSNKKNGTSLGSLVTRCENFLNDQWKFTVDIGKYKGRFYTPKKKSGTVIIPIDPSQNESRTVRNRNIVSRLMQNNLRRLSFRNLAIMDI